MVECGLTEVLYVDIFYTPQYFYEEKIHCASQLGFSADWDMNGVKCFVCIQTGKHKVICPWLSLFAQWRLANSLARRRLMLLCVTWRGEPVVWSSSASVQKTQLLTDQDPIHAEMLECTGRVLSSAHLNDFLAHCVHSSSANSFDYPLKLEHINGRTWFDCLRVCTFP